MLAVVCTACRADLTLRYQPDGPAEPYRWQQWACPICAGHNSLNLSGHIVRVLVPES